MFRWGVLLKLYRMTRRRWTRYKHRMGSVVCSTCELVIKIGEMVVSHEHNNGNKLRHLPCAEKVGIWP
jgi:hypothetical protein